jgi:hypothetical protein
MFSLLKFRQGRVAATDRVLVTPLWAADSRLAPDSEKILKGVKASMFSVLITPSF